MVGSVARELCGEVRAELRAAADPGRAPAMQAYMKSAMPFLGVGANERRSRVRALARRHPLPNAAAWRSAVGDLWRRAKYREERYAACDLVLDPRCAGFLDLDALPLLEEMIVTGAWWDFTDPLATHAVGKLLGDHPRKLKPAMRRWARSSDLWKRRVSILCQLHFGPQTDLDLLQECIEANVEDEDFFIRKAIGWALRHYARTDPGWTRRMVKQLGPKLSPLSRREALKHLGAS